MVSIVMLAIIKLILNAAVHLNVKGRSDCHISPTKQFHAYVFMMEGICALSHSKAARRTRWSGKQTKGQTMSLAGRHNSHLSIFPYSALMASTGFNSAALIDW
jgi:hypothetical protein